MHRILAERNGTRKREESSKVHCTDPRNMKISRVKRPLQIFFCFFKEKANLATSKAENAVGCMALERMSKEFTSNPKWVRLAQEKRKKWKIKKDFNEKHTKAWIFFFWLNTWLARQTWVVFTIKKEFKFCETETHQRELEKLVNLWREW